MIHNQLIVSIYFSKKPLLFKVWFKAREYLTLKSHGQILTIQLQQFVSSYTDGMSSSLKQEEWGWGTQSSRNHFGTSLQRPQPWKHLVNLLFSLYFMARRSFLGRSACLLRKCWIYTCIINKLKMTDQIKKEMVLVLDVSLILVHIF